MVKFVIARLLFVLISLIRHYRFIVRFSRFGSSLRALAKQSSVLLVSFVVLLYLHKQLPRFFWIAAVVALPRNDRVVGVLFSMAVTILGFRAYRVR